MIRKTYVAVALYENPISNEQWETLEHAGNVKLSDEHRKQLQGAIETYREYAALEASALRPGKVRPILEKTTIALTAANEVLGELCGSSAPQEGAFREMREISVLSNRGYLSINEISELAARLDHVVQIAREAIARLPDSVAGKDGDAALPALLRALHPIYRDAGGMGTYTLNAKSFWFGCCDLAGSHPHSQDAIAQAMKIALGSQSA